MPNWKKLIVSGSDASLNSLEVNQASGSFSGSFQGDGSQLTGITVDAATTVEYSFTSQTSISITHSFETKNIIVSVYNSDDEQIIPQSVTTTTNNTVDIVFQSATSGRVVLVRGGHLVSGSIAIDPNYLSVSSSILPQTTEVFDLGSADKRWRDIYLSGSTIDLGGTLITRDGGTGAINFKDSGTQELKTVIVKELQIGTGVNARKIQVDAGTIKFSDSNNVETPDSLTMEWDIVSNKPFFIDSQTNILSGSSTSILQIPSSSYSAAIFDYSAYSGSNARAGSLTAVCNGTTIAYNEVSTGDIGDTSNLELSVVLDSGNFSLEALTSNDGWTVKSHARGI